MRTVKKILILTLVAGMLLSLLPAVHAEDAFTYQVRDDGVWITGGPTVGDLVIPAEIGGVPVVGIAKGAYRNRCAKITSVRLPETLRYIEAYALNSCTNISDPIAIPDGVEWISPYAFGDTPISGKAFSAAERFWRLTGTRFFRQTGAIEGYSAIEEDGVLYWIHEGEAELVNIGPDVDATLMLPETVGGYPLTSAGPFCAHRNDFFGSLHHLIVPGSVRTIREYAFWESGLDTLYLCEGVESLGKCSLSLNTRGYVTLPRSAELVDADLVENKSDSLYTPMFWVYADTPAAAVLEDLRCDVQYREGSNGKIYGVWGGFSFRVADGGAEIYEKLHYTSFPPEAIEDWPVKKISLAAIGYDRVFLIPSAVTEIDSKYATYSDLFLYLVYPGSYGERFCKANRLSYESVYTYLGVPFEDTPEDRWYYDAVCHCYHTGLMSGVSETRFSPNSTTSRAMLVTVLWRMADCPGAEAPCSFLDVAEGMWYTDAVAWAQENGIVNGVGEGRFDPDGAITREQLATILCRCLDGEADARGLSETAEFPDADHISPWALDAFAWAKTAGILKGQLSGSQVYLNPLGNTSRAELASVLMRLN